MVDTFTPYILKHWVQKSVVDVELRVKIWGMIPRVWIISGTSVLKKLDSYFERTFIKFKLLYDSV